jgi:hypothetical protein
MPMAEYLALHGKPGEAAAEEEARD